MSQISENKCEIFKEAIRDDLPILKLIKYFSLIQSQPTIARKLLPQMIQIALSNQYAIIYKDICIKLNVPSYQQNTNFQKLRQNMVNDTNNLHSDLKYFNAQPHAQNKVAQTLLKLGKIYFQYGDFKQTSQYLNSLSKIILTGQDSIKYQSYASQLALSIYYLKQFSSLSRFNTKHVQKNFLKKMADLCIIKDLNNIDTYHRNQDFSSLGKMFKNVLQMEINNIQISKNRVMSYTDLGFLYSILTIAYKQKQDINFVKWSYNLQNKFLNNRYKQILYILQQQCEKRCYLPFIKNIYNVCHQKIKKRILVDIVSSYDRCPFDIIQKYTGVKEGEVKLFAKNNSDVHFIFDDITRSVVINRNILPLYEEVQILYTMLKKKYLQELSIQAREENQFGMGERRFGGMGGMFGGMGMHGMGMHGMHGMARMGGRMGMH